MVEVITANTKVYYKTLLGEIIYGVEITLGENYAKLEHFRYYDRLNFCRWHKYKICKLTEINTTLLELQGTIREVMGVGIILMSVAETTSFRCEISAELPLIVF